MRAMVGLAALLAACTPQAVPAPSTVVREQSLLLAQVAMRDDLDLVAAVQRRLLQAPSLPGKVLSQGWSGPGLYSVAIEGRCEDNAELVAAMSTFLNQNGATRTRCTLARSFAPGEPATFDQR